MSEIKQKLDGLRIDRTDEPESKSKWWIPVAVVVLFACAFGAWRLAQPSALEVRTAIAREVSVGGQQTVLNASGYVTARRQATVSSKVTGKVLEVLIEEGMEVEKGQVLATLDDSNVSTSLRLTEAQVRAARSELEETRVRLAKGKLDLERTERLVRHRITSQEALDNAEAEVEALQARLESQREATRVAERQLGVMRQQLDDTIIRAPFAGIVVSKNAQPGEMISPTSAGGGFTRTGIGTVVDMSSLEIEVDVNEAYINRVSPDQPVEATLDAYPEWKIPASVIAIIPTADRQKATVQVRIGFDELDPRILPDMGIKVAFQSGGDREPTPIRAVVVPKSAITSDAGRDVVYVVTEGKAERRAVAVSSAGDDETVLSAGVSSGEIVVLDAPPELRDGVEVKTVEEAS